MPTPNTYTFLDGLLRGVVGGGDVTGPATSVVNRIAAFADATGKVIKDSGIVYTSLILASGAVAFAGNQSMGGNKITNLATPTVSTDAATKAYVDSAASSITADGVTLQLVANVMSVKTNGISNAKLRQSAGCSIVARVANSMGDVADLVVGADDNVVMRTAGALTSGKITSANISGAAAITPSQMADGAACSLLGRSANTMGARADISAGANGLVFLRRSNALTAALLLDENVDAAAAISGGKINPAFGAQDVTSSNYFGGLDNSAIAGTGGAATFRAGDATGPSGIRNGGLLTLRSGTGATSAGNVLIQRGSATVLSALVTDTTVGESTLSQLSLGASASLTLAGTAVMTWGAATIQMLQSPGVLEFGISVATPKWRQAVATAGGVTGAAMLLNAQDASGNGSSGGALTVRAGDATGGSGTRNGGALTLRSGTGATAQGALTIIGGSGAGGVAMYGRNAANSADVLLMYWDAPSGRLVVGDSSALSTAYFYLQSNLMQLRVGTNSILDVTPSVIRPMISTLSWDQVVSTPTISQVVSTGGTATGNAFTINAQDCSGTTAVTAGAMTLRAGDATGGGGTRNGGALTLRSGTGATADGDLTVKRGSKNVLAATATSGLTVTIGSANGPVIISAGGAIDYSVYMITNSTTRHKFSLDSVDFDDQQVGSMGTTNLDLMFQGVQFMRMRREIGVSKMSFFGATAVAKPTVTGSRGGNAALASALSALASLGLLTDSSS